MVRCLNLSALPSSACWLFVHRLTNLKWLSHLQTSGFTYIQKRGKKMQWIFSLQVDLLTAHREQNPFQTPAAEFRLLRSLYLGYMSSPQQRERRLFCVAQLHDSSPPGSKGGLLLLWDVSFQATWNSIKTRLGIAIGKGKWRALRSRRNAQILESFLEQHIVRTLSR